MKEIKKPTVEEWLRKFFRNKMIEDELSKDQKEKTMERA